MTKAIVTAEMVLTHFPKLVFISNQNGNVIYSKSFDESVSYDPALVACSLNGLSLFLKNTFNKSHIGNVTLDNLGMKNICADDTIITYLYEGAELENCPAEDFARRLVTTQIINEIQDPYCQISDIILDELDGIVTELFG